MLFSLSLPYWCQIIRWYSTFTRSKQLCDDPCVILDKIALMTLIFHNKRYSILWSSPIYSGMMFLKADTCLDHDRNWSEEFFRRYGNAQRIFNTANMFHQPNPQFTGQDMYPSNLTKFCRHSKNLNFFATVSEGGACIVSSMYWKLDHLILRGYDQQT